MNWSELVWSGSKRITQSLCLPTPPAPAILKFHTSSNSGQLTNKWLSVSLFSCKMYCKGGGHLDIFSVQPCGVNLDLERQCCVLLAVCSCVIDQPPRCSCWYRNACSLLHKPERCANSFFAFHQRKLVSQRMVIYAKRQPFKLWPYQVDKEDKAKEKYWDLECENTETWQKIKENT